MTDDSGSSCLDFEVDQTQQHPQQTLSQTTSEEEVNSVPHHTNICRISDLDTAEIY